MAYFSNKQKAESGKRVISSEQNSGYSTSYLLHTADLSGVNHG